MLIFSRRFSFQAPSFMAEQNRKKSANSLLTAICANKKILKKYVDAEPSAEVTLRNAECEDRVSAIRG